MNDLPPLIPQELKKNKIFTIYHDPQWLPEKNAKNIVAATSSPTATPATVPSVADMTLAEDSAATV